MAEIDDWIPNENIFSVSDTTCGFNVTFRLSDGWFSVLSSNIFSSKGFNTSTVGIGGGETYGSGSTHWPSK